MKHYIHPYTELHAIALAGLLMGSPRTGGGGNQSFGQAPGRKPF